MEQSSSAENHDSKRILLVDDEAPVLKSLSKALKLLNNSYDVITASSGEDALSYIEQNSIDLLITDLMLPRMNGLALAANLQQLHPEVSSILVTAYGNDAIFKKAEQYGCIAYLSKPFNFGELASHINGAFENSGNFRVSLPGINLVDLLHLYRRNKGSAVLCLSSGEHAGTVNLEKGRISQARLNDRVGPTALCEIMSLKSGSINALSDSVHDTQTQNSLSIEVNDIGLVGLDFEESSRDSLEFSQLSAAITEKFLTTCSKGELEAIYKIFKLNGYFPSSSNTIHTPADCSGVLRAPTGTHNRTYLSPNDDGPSDDEDLNLQPDPDELVIYRSPTRKRQMAEAKKLTNKGVEYFKKHQFDRARDSWERALSLDANNQDAKRNLAILKKVELSLKN